MVKSAGAQRESDGVVVPVIGVQQNTPGGKGPDFGHADQVGTREGMAGLSRSNYPGIPSGVVAVDGSPSRVKVQRLQRAGQGQERVVRLDAPLNLIWTLMVLRRGRRDPTWDRDTDGTVWKGWRTPSGPVTAALRMMPGGAELGARAWGPGADWLLDRVPPIVGQDDDPTGFTAHHGLVDELRRRYAGWRVTRTGLVMESLVPSVIEQRVTGTEAFAAYRLLVREFGECAPGPGAELGLMVAPTPAGWAAIPSWAWLNAGVDGSRAATVLRACVSPGRLEELADRPAEASRRLAALPGIGRWTVAEVAHTALGDADAVSFGDYHVAKDIGWALTGAPVDDDGLAELLAPYAPHRYRVQRLIELAGVGRPRRGPRTTLPTHVPRR